MSKATPGPWVRGHSDEGRWQIRTDEGEPWVIAEMAEGCMANNLPSYEEDHANAQLIAAAPDLLEYAIAERACRQGKPTPWGHDCDWCGACVARLEDMREAAIAKAEGVK